MKINISELICYKVAFLAKSKRILIDQQFKDLDLCRTQWQAMARFNFLKVPCTQQQLLKSMDIDRAHLTRTLDSLEQRNLIKRSCIPGNKRACHVVLTTSGKALLKKIECIMEEQTAAMLAGLSDKEAKNFTKLLDKITDNVLADLGQTRESQL